MKDTNVLRGAFIVLVFAAAAPCRAEEGRMGDRPIRFATYNVSLRRTTAGELIRDLRSPENRQVRRIAEVIQRVRPQVLLLNEFDYDDSATAARLLQDNFLGRSQNGQPPIRFPYRYSGPVNTGIPSGFDLDGDNRADGPADALGFGRFPGQYGMLVLSQFPIDQQRVRSFQKFLSKDMPGNRLPRAPGSTRSYYRDEVLQRLRLSSKSHWDVPIKTSGGLVHFLVAHPTPPVFDGPEDRNGCRNHDEIRFFADYVEPSRSQYLYDDNGNRGGLRRGSHFVIAGDLNADPLDGASQDRAVRQLLDHPLIQSEPAPTSRGGLEASRLRAGPNQKHRGSPAHDTSDFGQTGNLRVDYVLPSRSLRVVRSGVFWPSSKEAGHDLVGASDHRLVWADVLVKPRDSRSQSSE